METNKIAPYHLVRCFLKKRLFNIEEIASMSTNEATLPPETEELLASERFIAANSLIKNYVIAATGLGLVPIPVVDLGALMALQIKLVHGLASHYGVSFKENMVKSLVTSLVSGGGAVVGVMGLSSLAKLVPVLGTLGGGASVAITGGAVTYAVGQVFAKHFESGGTLLNFDANKVREMFKRKVKEGEAVARDIKDGEQTAAAA
jgi:uncharacterized protein (DUF697 family)